MDRENLNRGFLSVKGSSGFFVRNVERGGGVLCFHGDCSCSPQRSNYSLQFCQYGLSSLASCFQYLFLFLLSQRRGFLAVLLLLGLAAPAAATQDVIQMRNPTKTIAEFGNHKGNGGVRVVVEIGDGAKLASDARTINYTVGGTAERGEGKDYTIEGCSSSTCSVRLPENRHSAVITIYVNDDGIDEDDLNPETIILTLQDGSGDDSGYTVNRNRIRPDNPLYTYDKTTVTILDDDTRGLTFHRRWPDVPEGGSRTYTVKLKSQPTEPVEVMITSNNPDVTTTPTSLLFNPTSAVRWDTAQTVTVNAAHDSDAEDDTATLTHTTSGGDYGGANALSIDRPVSVNDDETAGPITPQLPRISLTGGDAVTEGVAASFTVNADRVPTARLTVNVEVMEPPNQDFVAASHEGVRTVTLNAGATSATFTVPTVDDSTDEFDGAVQVFVNDGTGYVAGQGGRVNVNDNDSLIPAVSFASVSSSAAESAGTRDVTVNISPAPSGGLTLNYSVTGTATAGSGNDFTIQGSGSLTIAAGATSATIPVAINDDSAQENAETVILTLAGGAGYTVGSTSVHTLTIADNDSTGQATLSLSGPTGADEGNSGTSDQHFTVSLSKAPSRFVSWHLCFTGSATIDATGGGTIPAGADYQAISGGTPIDLRGRSPVCTSRTFKTTDSSFTNTDLGIRIKGDTESESDETVTVTLRIDDGPDDVVLGTSVVTYTIRNDDTQANKAPTVSNAIPNQTATAGTAFSYAFPTNTFNDADSDSLTYTAAKSDGSTLPSWLSFDANTRTFSGTPQAGDTGTLSVKVTADDGNSGAVSDTFDIVVSAAPGTPGLVISRNTLGVTEGGTGSYTVKLQTAPTGTVTVAIVSNNADVTVRPSSLTFNANGSNLWNTAQTVTVSVAQDNDDVNDSATLTHTASGGGYGSLTATLEVTVTDNETRPSSNDDEETQPPPPPTTPNTGTDNGGVPPS